VLEGIRRAEDAKPTELDIGLSQYQEKLLVTARQTANRGDLAIHVPAASLSSSVNGCYLGSDGSRRQTCYSTAVLRGRREIWHATLSLVTNMNEKHQKQWKVKSNHAIVLTEL
jgi:hypothetical protein